jgi:hypothetical protein
VDFDFGNFAVDGDKSVIIKIKFYGPAKYRGKKER